LTSSGSGDVLNFLVPTSKVRFSPAFLCSNDGLYFIRSPGFIPEPGGLLVPPFLFAPNLVSTLCILLSYFWLLSLWLEFIKLRLSAPTQKDNTLICEIRKEIKSGFNLTIGYKSSSDPKLIESVLTLLEILYIGLKMGAVRGHFLLVWTVLATFSVRRYLPAIRFSRLAILSSSTFKRDRKSSRNCACDCSYLS